MWVSCALMDFISLKITKAPSSLVPLNVLTRSTKAAVHSVGHLLIYALFYSLILLITENISSFLIGLSPTLFLNNQLALTKFGRSVQYPENDINSTESSQAKETATKKPLPGNEVAVLVEQTKWWNFSQSVSSSSAFGFSG